MLVALLEADDPNESIALEVTNDLVVLNAQGVVTISIQNKHSLNDGKITVRSRTWWESAAVFLDLLDDSATTPDTSFVIATTFDVDPESVFQPFVQATRTDGQTNALLDAVDAIAKEKPNQDYATIYDAWAAAPREKKLDLLRRLRIRAGLASVNEAQDEIVRTLLARTFHPHTVKAAAEELVGWLELRIRTKITSGGCVVKVKDARDKMGQLRDKHSLTVLPRLIPEEYDVEAAIASREVYLRQLILIGAERDDLALAVECFGEANRHRAWWFDSGLLGDDHIEQFDRSLRMHWVAAKGEHSSTQDERERGKKVYYQCLKAEGKLGTIAADREIIWGSYHVLSQRRALGWHPRYGDLLGEGAAE